MNNKITYHFWQHVKHVLIIGVGVALVIKSVFVLAGHGTPLTPFRAIIYGSLLLLYVPGIPWYVYKTYIKEETP